MEQHRACYGHRALAPMGRRELLRAGSLGLFGLGLTDLLRAREAAPARFTRTEGSEQEHLARYARRPFQGQARTEEMSCCHGRHQID